MFIDLAKCKGFAYDKPCQFINFKISFQYERNELHVSGDIFVILEGHVEVGPS